MFIPLYVEWNIDSYLNNPIELKKKTSWKNYYLNHEAPNRNEKRVKS